MPAHDEKTDAVQLYAEKIVTVQSADKIKTQVRVAYKILRPGGRDLGTVVIPFDSQTKINWLHAWCIPAQGKDYEVKDKDGAEVALPAVQGSELIIDVRAKVLHIPGARPGKYHRLGIRTGRPSVCSAGHLVLPGSVSGA